MRLRYAEPVGAVHGNPARAAYRVRELGAWRQKDPVSTRTAIRLGSMAIYASRRVPAVRRVDGVHTPTYSQDGYAQAGRTDYRGRNAAESAVASHSPASSKPVAVSGMAVPSSRGVAVSAR